MRNFGSPPAVHVVIPAAGVSRRMGRPKLMLKLGERTVIAWLVESLTQADVATISVLVRPNDTALLNELQNLPATPVVADHITADMKESVTLLLKQLPSQSQVNDEDGWMLIPADYPIVSSKLVGEIIDIWRQQPDRIIVPTHHGKRGHPVIFPWRLTSLLPMIPANMGLNWFLQQTDIAIVEFACHEPSVHWDLDTPDDFERIQQIFELRLKSQEL